MKVSGPEITTQFVEDVLDNDSDIEINISDSEVDNTEIIGSDSEESELDAYAPVGSRDESTMWKASNDAPNIKPHNYSDSMGGVQPQRTKYRQHTY
ncbi:hypothetical protein C0J52_27084 [Blattella germanica]|nr:hypothetical protein C0J52_27084 [Blattella germanica]